MKRFVFFALLLLLFTGCGVNRKRLVEYVNPFIGTSAGAHTYPGAAVPFGMVQLSPDGGNDSEEDFFNYGNGHQYDYRMSEIQGFGHLHLSGTANDPAGDISVLPMVGLAPSAVLIKSKIAHQEEQASPGYYAVNLLGFGIKAELTTTLRCGLHRYTFPENQSSVIRIDLAYHNGGRPVACYFRKIDDSTFVGHRFSTGYADDKRVFFAVRTSKPVRDLVLFADSSKVNSSESVLAVGAKACLVFSTAKDEQILMKVALSFAGFDGAMAGLQEIPDWDFDSVRKAGELAWEKELEKLQVSSEDQVFKEIFYTAVYHSYLSSMRFDDAQGKYRGANGKIHNGENIYSVFGLWDTYRAIHPLYTLTQVEKVPQIINSFLAFYDQYGLLPVWEMAFCETHCMTGYHAIPVIADAILKGIGGFDYDKAYEAMKASAYQDIRTTKEYRDYKFVPFEASSASVTKTTEYSYDDWCIAMVARKIGRSADYEAFNRRGTYWKNLFDTKVNFIRPRYADGNWVPSFDPLSDHTNGKESYTEGNAWHYTFMVPQDANGLMEMFGSREDFIQKLDSFFKIPYPTDNYLGGMGVLIGQYAQGNQPSHHIPYLYHFAGTPWKGAAIVKKVMESYYSNKPDGITGNEDTGGMSAWYVWNAIGLYPFNPASGEYLIGSPMADQTQLTTANGKQFVIKTEHLSKQNIYVQEAWLNGRPYSKSYITHVDVMKGGMLLLLMGNKPSQIWGHKAADYPGKYNFQN
jgi:predicted alpha-1,2-mannosidase